MELHANNYVVLTVSGKKAHVLADYKQLDQNLIRVKTVTLTDDLKKDQHINNICDKANQTIGFLSIGATILKERAYFTLVTPLVEYASTVWGPHTDADTHTEDRDSAKEGC